MTIKNEFSTGPVSVLGLCNPLLDISANVDTSVLEKYHLKANNVIMAGQEQKDLCSYLVSNYQVDYTAGGSAQNTMRVIAGLFKKQQVKSNIRFTGSIGRDKFGDMMAKKAQEDGVEVIYQIDLNEPSGTCAVLLTDNGKNRSLCAFMGASLKFSHRHLEEHWGQLVEDTKIIYISGFLLTISVDTFLLLGRHVLNSAGKTYCLNLSAPYISEVYGERLFQVIPYVDIVFGNDTEARAYAKFRSWPTDIELADVASRIVSEPKLRTANERIVVITRGHEPIIVATRSSGEILIKEFPCKSLEEHEIVDSNGAGDAFVGGFLSQYSQEESLDLCVEVGSYAAREIIRQSGIVVPEFNELPKILKNFSDFRENNGNNNNLIL